jgi:hypothetical protein
VLRIVLRKVDPTFELWEFAARYSLRELEEYCRSDPQVLSKIHSTISNPNKGIEYLRSVCQLPPSMLNQLVCSLIAQLTEERNAAKAKLEPFYHQTISCNGCAIKPIKGLRFKCKVCPDYDLCENCHASKVHDIHSFSQRPRRVADLLSKT